VAQGAVNGGHGICPVLDGLSAKFQRMRGFCFD